MPAEIVYWEEPGKKGVRETKTMAQSSCKNKNKKVMLTYL